MGDEEARARNLMDEGRKGLKRTSLWNMLAGSQKYEDAKDKFNRAANLFKMAKAWGPAAEAHELAAEQNDALEIPHEAVNDRLQAAECWKKVDITRAVSMFRKVATTYCEQGKFGRAAGVLESVGELLEAQKNLEGAAEAYSKAADYHASENAGSRATKAQEKVALLQGMLQKYDKAATTFESLGSAALDSPLLKFGAKKHYFHAGICLLARGDVVAARLSNTRFGQLDLSWGSSRECRTLEQLIDAVEAQAPDDFSQALADFDSIQTLTPWETTILLRIRVSLVEQAEATPDLR